MTIVLTGLLALAGCTAQPIDKSLDVTLDVAEVANEIMSAGGMSVQNAVKASMIGLDETQVTSFAAYQGSDEDANRVYLFAFADAAHLNDVKYISEKEQDAIITKFMNLGGDAFEVAKSSRALVKGNYLLLLSVPNYEEAKAVFKGKFE